MAGAFIQRFAVPEFIHGVHLQLHVFQYGGGALAQGAAILRQPAPEADAGQDARGGAGQRPDGPDRAQQRRPVERAQGGKGGFPDRRRRQRAHGRGELGETRRKSSCEERVN